MDSNVIALWRLCALLGACAGFGAAGFGVASFFLAGTDVSPAGAIGLVVVGVVVAWLCVWGAVAATAEPLRAVAVTAAVAPTGVTLLALDLGGLDMPLSRPVLFGLAVLSVVFVGSTVGAVMAIGAERQAAAGNGAQPTAPRIITG